MKTEKTLGLSCTTPSGESLKRTTSLLVIVVSMAFMSACAPDAANATPAYYDYVIPPSCPYSVGTIQFNGDSVSRGTADQVGLPGYTVFNAGEGGASYSLSTPSLPSIGERVI